MSAYAKVVLLIAALTSIALFVAGAPYGPG
jgi:hypothetical protein